MLTTSRNYVNGPVATQQCSSCQNINYVVRMAKCLQSWIWWNRSQGWYTQLREHTRVRIAGVYQSLAFDIWNSVCSTEPVKLTLGRHTQTSMEDDKKHDVEILKRACDAQVFEKGLDRRLWVARLLRSALLLWGWCGEVQLWNITERGAVPPCVPFMRHWLFELPWLFLFGYASKSSGVK